MKVTPTASLLYFYHEERYANIDINGCDFLLVHRNFACEFLVYLDWTWVRTLSLFQRYIVVLLTTAIFLLTDVSSPRTFECLNVSGFKCFYCVEIKQTRRG